MGDHSQQAHPRTFTSKLNWLFEHVMDSSGQPYLQKDIVARIREHGVPVSDAQISLLCSGRSSNPSFSLVMGICQAFGVKAAFFADEDAIERTEEELGLLAVMRRANVRNLCLRADDLPDETLQPIIAMVEQVHHLTQQQHIQNEGKLRATDPA